MDTPLPQPPPMRATGISILQIAAAARLWAQLYVTPSGSCVCGEYSFMGVCGHVVEQETLCCGTTRAADGTAKSCHEVQPKYQTTGYVLKLMCYNCYDAM